MKHIYLLTVMLLTVLISNAQFNKGDKLLGGAFNISYSTGKDQYNNKQNGWGLGLSPSYAWFTSASTALGVRLNGSYSHQSSSQANSPTSSGHSLGYGTAFFIQKYKNLDPRLSLYAEFGVAANFSNGKSTSTYSNQIQGSKANNWNTGAYITPGIMYKLSQRLLLDISLNGLLNVSYTKYKSTSIGQEFETISKSSNFSVGTSFNNNNLSTGVGIGFKWLLK